MKIVLVTIGSRGDVQPMVALCLAFQAVGHEAVLAGPPERAAWARGLGCSYIALGPNITALLDSLDNAYSLVAIVGFAQKIRRMVAQQFAIIPEVIKGADLVVGASLCFGLSSIAEAMDIPYRFVAFTPQLMPSSAHPCPVFKHHGWPGWWNRFSWHFMLFFDRFNFSQLINRQRRSLGLASLSHAWYHLLGRRLIVATDPQIAALPPDAVPDTIQTGYMRLAQPHHHLPGLEHFLNDGPPPIYAGFGSMPRADQVRLVPVITRAARQAGQRLVLARFWNDCSEPNAKGDVFYISRYPHEQLFPRMAAIIHHGGAGTTATAALGGVPQIIVPHALDQYYWGHQIFTCGLGPRPIRRRALTAARLTQAIAAVIADSSMAVKAKAVQGQIQGSEGAKTAVGALLDGF